MYVINPEKIDASKLYKCNRPVANWLIYEKHLPLFSRKDGFFYFARTDELSKAIKEMPPHIILLSIL